MPTLDPLGGLLDIANNPFGASDNSEWNLVEGSFISDQNGQKVTFFVNTKGLDSSLAKTAVGKMTDSGGNRLVKYEYTYRNGQVVKNLGRKAQTFNIEITFYGPLYQQIFNQFINVAVNTKTSGVLSHPVRGSIRGSFEEYEFIHAYDAWNSVAIRAVFTEDNTIDLTTLN